jgi:hypothetical protein
MTSKKRSPKKVIALAKAGERNPDKLFEEARQIGRDGPAAGSDELVTNAPPATVGPCLPTCRPPAGAVEEAVVDANSA